MQELHSYANFPAIKVNTVAPNNYEELLLRWIKLGRNEVQALFNPGSHIWASVTSI
jgi:hypothetical protein